MSLSRNLLQFPLLGELLIQLLKFLDHICAGLDNGVFGRDLAIGLHAELEGREERVGNLVGGEQNVGRPDEGCAEQIAQSVVFFVEEEDGRVGDACECKD